MWESRVAPLSGVAFAVLLVSSALVINNYEFMPPAEEVAAFYAGDSVRIMTGAYIGLLAAFALVWFSASSHASLRRIDDDSGRLSLIALGGGVFASAMFALGYLATFAVAERGWIHDAVDPGGAAALADLASLAVGTGAAYGLAALIGASAIANLRSRDQYRWTGWVSGLIALGLISPFSYIVIGLAVIWVAVAGVWMYRANAARSETVSA